MLSFISGAFPATSSVPTRAPQDRAATRRRNWKERERSEGKLEKDDSNNRKKRQLSFCGEITVIEKKECGMVVFVSPKKIVEWRCALILRGSEVCVLRSHQWKKKKVWKNRREFPNLNFSSLFSAFQQKRKKKNTKKLRKNFEEILLAP